jgi:hypothetical protein
MADNTPRKFWTDFFQEGLKLTKEEESLAHLQGGIYDLLEEIQTLDQEFKEATTINPASDESSIARKLMDEARHMNNLLEMFTQAKAKLSANIREWALAIRTLEKLKSNP